MRKEGCERRNYDNHWKRAPLSRLGKLARLTTWYLTFLMFSPKCQGLLKGVQHCILPDPARGGGLRSHSAYTYTYCPFEREVQTMLQLGVTEPSEGPWRSPSSVLVPRPDGSVRFCIDFRLLNEVSAFDAIRGPELRPENSEGEWVPIQLYY